MPKRSVLARCGLLKIIEHINISKKAEKMNQKLPVSNIVPKKETSRLVDKKADKKVAITIPPAAKNREDREIIIFPSRNLPMDQKIMEMAMPTTSNNPLDISTGKFEKGRKKIGSNTTTIKREENESLSNVLDCISLILYYK